MALKGAIIYNVNIDSMENQEENVMKVLKVLSASAIAAAVAAAVTVPASAATTYKDVIEATKACGVQAHNVQQLENFLEANDSYFTSDEYDEMVADMENIRDTYVIPAAKKAGLPTDDLAALSEDDKILIGRQWTEADKEAICNDLIELGADYDVTVTITKASESHYDVTATINKNDSNDSADSNNSGSSSSSSTTDSTKKDSAVAPSGGVMKAGSNATAIAFGGIATLLAATGIVVVAKKNKE